MRRRSASYVSPLGKCGNCTSWMAAAQWERSQLWPRSASRPSETSMAAVAMPTSAWPSATRGRGFSSSATHRRGQGSGRTTLPCRWARPKAARPGRPETQIWSPTWAPSRRKACPGSTSPMAVMQTLRGPLVVSPPITSTPYSLAQAKKPSAKAAIQASSTTGRAPARVTQRGVAPIAARSERLTASAFQPRFFGSVSGKKCVPATSMSVVTANCLPGVGWSGAQSSPGPRMAEGVGRAKYLSISANSPAMALLALLARSDHARAQHGSNLVEHADDVLVAIGAAKELGQFDGPVDDDAVGRFGMILHLEGAEHHHAGLDRRQFTERAVDVGADPFGQQGLLGDHA